MAFETYTRRELRRLVAEQIDDLVLYDTATAGAAATITLPDALHTDDTLIDLWIYLNDGTSEGDERVITDNVGSTNVVTVGSNWTSTPDTTTVAEIHSKFRYDRYNRAIDSAIRRLWRHSPVAEVEAEVLTNCALLNPTFRDWANGAATNPDSWTTSSEYVQQAVPNPKLVAGAGEYRYKSRVWSNSTSVILEVDDGTTQDTDAHDGTGYNLLEVDHDAAAGATAVTVKIGHSGASAVSSIARVTTSVRGDYSMQITWADGTIAIVDSVFAPTGYSEFRYSLPSAFRSLHRVEYSPSEDNLTSIGIRNAFNTVPRSAWTGGVSGQSPSKYIQFNPNMVSFGDDIFIKVYGMGSPTIPTNDDSSIEGPIQLLADMASYYLLRPGQEGDRFHRDAQEALLDLRVAYPSGSYIIDPI